MLARPRFGLLLLFHCSALAVLTRGLKVPTGGLVKGTQSLIVRGCQQRQAFSSCRIPVVASTGIRPVPAESERLACRVKGFYPFPQGVNGPIAWLFRDTHQAIEVTTAGGTSKLLLDFMTEGGPAHPVWWDEAVKWRVLLGGSICGEVRVRRTGEICKPDSKLERFKAAAMAYDTRMNLYTNNCRIFCARMEREVQRFNDDEANDAELPSAKRRMALADARLALKIAQAAMMPMLYPGCILLLCWTGFRDS